MAVFAVRQNLSWWERLDKARAVHDVTWEWTKGHVGHVLQEAADRAARGIAAAGRVDESILEDAVERVGTIEAVS
jgi:ribonuclease HI